MLHSTLTSFSIRKLYINTYNSIPVYALVFLVAMLSSCDSKVVFEKNVSLPENRWEESNIVHLETTIEDTAAAHNLYINVRNAGGYQFRNLFVFFTTTTPKGEMERDTVELILADERGKWLGDGLGDIWDNRILFKRNFRFPQAGIYKFDLQQAMRVPILPQIMDAGIRIERAD
ncbi:MAG TPA: gliding motility lipoprotein GldH [Bacteroidia bacterium]|nr:gliding motility lipoprotein GldH [Bacteroidia bacterium]